MGKLFSARVRRKPPTTLLAKNSQINKVISTSKRQAGWKALHSRPVISIEAQNIFGKTKIARKLMRICTGKALDMQEIYDKQARQRIQKAMQDYVNNTHNQNEERTLTTISRNLGSPEKAEEFFEDFGKARRENMAKLKNIMLRKGGLE